MEAVQAADAVLRSGLVRVGAAPGEQVLPIESRIGTAFADLTAETQREYEYLLASVRDENIDLSFEAMIELQSRLGDYRNRIELYSAITRKGVSAVETLLRS
ncbi:type III secretion system inner rod subunit SctI [Burkholderia dolosa]|uniref:Type III secretion system inner rod subunit SctI n=1 Tax=Burkholderia dolosa TaxID=152500 RepID=A0A892IC88_9BURK|nr:MULTISPECIES: type III secretion system inner rod subunit SctI [Burkholderia]AKE05316.1 hypothetical protein XM57_21785 [Burkholderia cepacia]AJY09851.1 hypothetical protein AK34_4726 [Burkholderia dolosa AU0158]AYZ94374.1 hypothetical protein EGY28_04445 [Burkholderia dolosa]ETP63862.1 hypothetical protein BDSB_25640 [Burkholderia dolosa PC543]MBR8313133.1 type III secretion system inner rod subunit SctI [Burkholderia dolosa]